MTTAVQEPRASEVNYGSFTIKARRQILHTLAGEAGLAVSNSDTRPVLKCFQVRVQDGTLRLAATNMEVTILAESTALVHSGDALAYIPAKPLLAILSEAPEGDITIKVRKNQAAITSEKGASWSLVLPAGDQFPPIPDVDLASTQPADRGKFLAALKMVKGTVSRDTSRPAFMQVDLSEVDGTMFMTSSDAGRLTRVRLEKFPVPMGVPAGGMELLIKVLGNTTVDTISAAVLDRFLLFSTGPTTVLINKFGAKFGEVEKLLVQPATENTLKLTMDREDLISAIRRVRINANPDTNALAMLVRPGQVVLEAKNKKDTAKETVLAGWPDSNGELLLLVNASSLLGMLAVHPSNACVFYLAQQVGQRRCLVLLADDEAGVTSIITQMNARVLGY